MTAQPLLADPPSLTPEQRDQTVTFGMLLTAVDGLAPAIRSYVAEVITPLVARVQDLEARPAVRYCGVWSDGRQFVEGNLTTWNGGLWICHAPATKAKPGGPDWQLIVKTPSVAR